MALHRRRQSENFSDFTPIRAQGCVWGPIRPESISFRHHRSGHHFRRRPTEIHEAATDDRYIVAALAAVSRQTKDAHLQRLRDSFPGTAVIDPDRHCLRTGKAIQLGHSTHTSPKPCAPIRQVCALRHRKVGSFCRTGWDNRVCEYSKRKRFQAVRISSPMCTQLA